MFKVSTFQDENMRSQIERDHIKNAYTPGASDFNRVTVSQFHFSTNALKDK